MATSAEASNQLGQLILSALNGVGLTATPKNYELWYAHLDGRNPALSRDIQKKLDSFGRMAQHNADALFMTHIRQGNFSDNVAEIVTRFQTEIDELYDALERNGDEALNRENELTDLSGQLSETSDDYPAIGTLLGKVINVAKEMHAQNEHLESRLADSTSEITNLQQNVKIIQAEAMKDPLTGVSNRTSFDRSIVEALAVAKANDEALSLLMADIDHFKSFNDTHGHQTGDQVLRLVAEVMNANVKGRDTLARFGGEEFVIILPQTSLDNAFTLGDRIREAVSSRRLKKRRTDEDLGAVTMSIGVAVLHSADTIESLIERADQCLYAAKENGRNQVMTEADLNRKSALSSDVA